MPESEHVSRDPEDVRVEYQAAHAQYSQFVVTRYSVAAFYLAGLGLLSQVGLDSNADTTQRVSVSILGILVGLSVWLLELRTRTLYTSAALHMIEIERSHWYTDPSDTYRGLMSQLHKTPPIIDPSKASLYPESPGPERPKIAWMRKPLPTKLSWHMTHSMAFDILYPATIVFWIVILISTLAGWIK